MIDAALPGPPPDGFLELPGMVYADDPGWLPEEPERIALLFSSLNPWMAQVDAHAFCVPGAVRAAVFARPGYVLDGRKAAWFGYWESTGDRAAEELVMAEVRRWARTAGAQLLLGPIDFSTVLHCRALLAAEPWAMPFVGEPWNPLRYGPSWQAMGFEPYVSCVSIVLDRDDIAALVADKTCIREKLAARGYAFERVRSYDVDAAHRRTVRARQRGLRRQRGVHADQLAGVRALHGSGPGCDDRSRAERTRARARRRRGRVHSDVPALRSAVSRRRRDPGEQRALRGPCGRGAAGDGAQDRRYDAGPPAYRTCTRDGVRGGGARPDRGVEQLFVSTMRADNQSRLLFPRYRCERWYGIFASPL